MRNRIWTWILAHQRFIFGASIFLLVVFWLISNIKGCSSAPASSIPAGEESYFFWRFLLVGLVIASVITYRSNSERWWVSLSFLAGAVLVALIILGKLDLFTWPVLGLPLFATAGFYGAYKIGGRMGAFLGFLSGLVAVTWYVLFVQGQPELKPDLKFLGNRITDDINLLIGILAAGLLLLAIWKKKLILWGLTFVVFVAWIGPEVIDRIQNRYASQLTPNVSQKTKDTWEEIWDSLLEGARQAVKPGAAETTSTGSGSPFTGAKTPIKEGGGIRESVLLNGNGEVNIPFDEPASHVKFLRFFVDPGAGYHQIAISINRQQDPSWAWHPILGKGITRYGGIGKFLKPGGNVLTIQYRVEQPVVLKNIYLE